MERGERAEEQRLGAELRRVLDRNIAALVARRREAERAQPPSERISAAMTRFIGSMTFVILHAVITAAWVAVNVGLVPGPRFDPDFVKLATAASVEAIFLSTFVLITQNRMAALADRRADLDLQISLLSEHELTRLIRLVAAMARRLGIEELPELEELEETRHDVPPEHVLDRIERAEGEGHAPPPA
jgi:uncharacterized membrane protein